MNRHPPEKDKSDRNIDDTYVYDSASGLYKPQSHENEEERREKRRGRNSRLPFFANVRRDWLTIFFSAVTLVVVGAYTYYAKGQWHEMIRAANAAKSAAETARLQLELSERPWVHAQISLSGPFTFTINGANIPLEIIRLNTGNSPALTSAIETLPVIGLKSGDPGSYVQQICRGAGMDTKVPILSTALFPNDPFPQQWDIGVPKEDIERSNKDTPGIVLAISVVVCIAYQPPFNKTALYHTGYVIDLVKSDPNSMAFKIGENVGREKLRLVLRQGVLAD